MFNYNDLCVALPYVRGLSWLVIATGQYRDLVLVGSPILIENSLKVNYFVRLSVHRPK